MIQLIYKRFIAIIAVGFVALSIAIPRQAEGALEGGESSLESQSHPLQPLNLTLRGALEAAGRQQPRCAPL